MSGYRFKTHSKYCPTPSFRALLLPLPPPPAAAPLPLHLSSALDSLMQVMLHVCEGDWSNANAARGSTV